MACLLERARRTEWRIWAESAPFAMKDELKRRGRSWNGEIRRGPKACFTDVDSVSKKCELSYLREEVYRDDRDVVCREVTALDRFSDRPL
jgi:DNA polymerase-3 subunit epsilon